MEEYKSRLEKAEEGIQELEDEFEKNDTECNPEKPNTGNGKEMRDIEIEWGCITCVSSGENDGAEVIFKGRWLWVSPNWWKTRILTSRKPNELQVEKNATKYAYLQHRETAENQRLV